MIIEYHHPKTVAAALKLIARAKPLTRPLGGGTLLNRPSQERFAVVDLQDLGLNKIRKAGNHLEIGATTTLHALSESPHPPAALKQTLGLEANYNLRQVASVAGTLVTCDGRSPFATAILALDAKLTILPGDEELAFGNLLPFRQKLLRGKLITRITIPLQTKLTYEYIARTPDDRPIVCAALAQWPSGRSRLALGGYSEYPRLALDGNDLTGIEAAARNTFAEAADEWASAEYRSEMAATLARRCTEMINSPGN